MSSKLFYMPENHGSMRPRTARATAEKGISNQVAGKANALVVPDIESGNILFKSLVWCAGGLAAGLVLGGSVPIVLTSRSDPPQARLAAIALASLE